MLQKKNQNPTQNNFRVARKMLMLQLMEWSNLHFYQKYLECKMTFLGSYSASIKFTRYSRVMILRNVSHGFLNLEGLLLKI